MSSCPLGDCDPCAVEITDCDCEAPTCQQCGEFETECRCPCEYCRRYGLACVCEERLDGDA